MLFFGTLTRLVDISDLFWHGAPAVILVLKLARMAGMGRRGERAGKIALWRTTAGKYDFNRA